MKSVLPPALILFFATSVLASTVVDTQQSKCYDFMKQITCPVEGEVFYGQDGNYTGSPRSFAKLGPDGTELQINATSWSMVRDNNTGLIWESKTNDSSIHDKDRTFPRCDTNPVTNGGNPGDCDLSNNSEGFIIDLNTSNFGGYSDWRVPTIKELLTLVHWDSAYPAINTFFFPNTQIGEYLSITYSNDPDYPNPLILNFTEGEVDNNSYSTEFYIMAVRGESMPEPVLSVDTYLNRTIITDSSTGLTWMGDVLTDGIGFTFYTNWSGALNNCENLSFRGFYDWRLPSINELLTIVDYNRFDPALAPEFSEIYSGLHSSTTGAIKPTKAWNLNVTNGIQSFSLFNDKIDDSFFGGAVLCVRAGYEIRPYEEYSVSIEISGEGIVAVTNVNSGAIATCNANCSLSYQENTTLVFTAIADRDASFSSWSGDCSEQSNDCAILMDTEKAVSATFYQNGDLSGNGVRGIEEVIIILQELTNTN
jgi:hypothetical protein